MILVTGGRGFVGSHLVELLKENEYEVYAPKRQDYNLEFADDCHKLIRHYKDDIECLVNCAALVGGIGFNQAHPYELLYRNLQINTNLIHWSVKYQIKKFVQIGTTCSYPKFCPPPFNESALWDGYPEETNAPYGNAKRISMEQLKAAYNEFGFNGVTVIPTNMYGPRDNFNPKQSHVIPAIIKKMFDAIDNEEKVVNIWGTGKATRDFIYVKDAAHAIMRVIQDYNNPLQSLNVGNGEQTSISHLVYLIQRLSGYKGALKWDTTKPDGQPKRALNISEIKHALDWKPETSLQEGLKMTIDWYKETRYGK